MNADQAREAGEATVPAIAPRVRHGRRGSWTGELAAPAPPCAQTRTADLVEREDTGCFYLRTYVNGHYLWQPVADPVIAIPDTGTWLCVAEHQNVYWYNHGTYRRRAGRYYPVVAPPVRRAHSLSATPRCRRPI